MTQRSTRRSRNRQGLQERKLGVDARWICPRPEDGQRNTKSVVPMTVLPSRISTK